MKKKLKILLIEDSSDDAELLMMGLNKQNLHADYNRVYTGKDLLEALEKEEWDIFLSDFMMPGFDGLEALKICKKKYPDIPFIIISGTIGEDIAVSAMKLGASDYLMKNNLQRLFPAIERELKEAAIRKEKRKVEEDLIKSEEQYRTLQENLPISVFRVNVNGDFISANPACVIMFGYGSFKELAEINTNDLYFNKNDRKTAINSYNPDGKVADFECRFLKKDGTVFWGKLNMKAVFDKNNRRIYQDGSISDITELKNMVEDLKIATKKAVESDNLKHAFISNLSHEIRTPLNGIVGLSELLSQEDITNEEKQEYLNLVKTNSDILIGLIDDLLDLSKIQAGDIKLNKNHFNVSKVLHEIANVYRNDNSLIEDKPMLVFKETFCDECKKTKIYSDQQRFMQIITNILNNAVKFTSEGSIHIHAEIKGNNIEIAIKDSGIGIPQDKIDFIFDRFTQIDSSSTREYSGTGIGLNITKNLVKILNGKIYVESEPGKGSCFYVCLPLK